MDKTKCEMIKKFQCVGCVSDCEPNDEKTETTPEIQAFCCKKHVVGTMSMGIGHILLGLPEGFNRMGLCDSNYLRDEKRKDVSYLRLYTKKDGKPEWDRFNIPVWAMVEDGYLFVRTYCPRVNMGFIDVIEGGDLSMVPDAVDVGKFVDEIN